MLRQKILAICAVLALVPAAHAEHADERHDTLAESETINPQAVRYINRVSDLFFVMSRFVNDKGAGDVLWEPGATRGGKG